MKPQMKIAVGLAGVLVVVAYSGLAYYFERSYVDPKPTGRKVRLLPAPFERGAPDFVVKYGVQVEPGTLVYEDKDPLDPISDADGYRGPGRFQILPNGITFSSTDGTDPNSGRHRYWLVIP